MQVKAIKTKKVVVGNELFEILDKYLPRLREKEVVIIASKIIALCQNDVIKNDGKTSKYELIKKEADFYLPEDQAMFGVHLSIKNNVFGSGIDESNGNGYYVLWPKNLQESTNKIWHYLRDKNKIKHLGVVVTDGRIMPLRKGVIGIGLSWCGFVPLRDYIGKPDLFGRHLHVTKANLVDGIAAGTVLNTGEGNEQTPLAVVSEISNIRFVNRTPSKNELAEMNINPKEDVFAKLITSVNWLKSGK